MHGTKILENTRGEAPLMPSTPVPLDLLSSGNSRPNKMSVCEASPSATTEPEFTENLRWSELTTKILNLLAEGPPEQRARELAEYIHILRTEKGFGTYFMRAVLDRIEMFIMRVKKILYSVDEESRAELPLIYKDQWLAFESTLRFATEFGKLIGEKQVTDTLIALSVDCWDQSIIDAKDGVLVPHMIKVLCQRVFEDKYDPKQVELVYEVARSFDNRALGDGNLVLAKTVFGCECRRLILEESYEHYVNESLTRCSCEETITKVATWRQSIFETSVALPFLGEPTRAMDRIIASDLTIPLFKKLAQEVSAAYKLFSETHFSNEMPRVHIPVEPAFKMLWGLEYFDGQKELPEGLQLAEKNCLYLRSVCKETFGELTPSWVTQVALQIRSEIKRFPTDPGEQITDSAAFIDFYCDAWNSHCRYISYHMMLMSRIDMLHDLLYFSMIDWVEVVLDVERENIFRHLGAVFLDYLLGQIDVNPYHKHEEYLKLTLVLVSFKYAQSDDFEAFRIYSLGHVLRPLVDEVAKKLQRDVTPRDCPELILAWMARMDYIRKKLQFPKKFYEFNRLMIATYFEFILYQMGILVREKNAQAINDMCILINDYESWEPENIYGMIAAVCQQCGREEIQRIFEETKGSLPESVFSATQEFDLLVNRISNLRVKTAVLNGFRYAINKEAVSRGSSALELVVQYYLPAVGMTVAVHRRTDECLRRVTKYANAFKYFSNLAEFSELFVESLAERAMNVFAFSFMVENVIFELVRQYLNPNCAKRCRDQLDDLAKSVTRMQSLPSLAGFQRTTVETGLCKKSEIDENKSDKATEESRQSAAKQAKLDELLRDGLTFDGIEFNVRVLHEKLWLMRPLEPEFSPPPSLKRIMKAFEETYKVEGKRRVLTWLPYYSRVEMLWRFTKDQRTYHVHIDSLTAAVMLLFEDLVDITFKDIQQSTKISSRRLKHLIDVLLKTNILVRKDNNDSQIFALNLDFRSWQREFILSVNYKEMENESKVDTASCSAEGDSMSEKAEKENDSVWRLSAVMARVAKHASKISKKALFERTIWELGNWGCRNPQQLHNALEHLVKHSYVEYEKTSKTFIYIP